MATMESINAKANAGLTTGIIGTSLGALASGVLNGNGNGILGMLGAIDKTARTIDVEGVLPAALEAASDAGGFKIPLGDQQLSIPPEDIEKIKQYIMQGGG